MLNLLNGLDGRMTEEGLRKVMRGECANGFIEGLVSFRHELLEGQLTLSIELQDETGIPLAIYEPVVVHAFPCTTRFPMSFRMAYAISNALTTFDVLNIDYDYPDPGEDNET